MFLLLLLILLSVILLYRYIKKQHSFWKDVGVPYLEPKFPFGEFDLRVAGSTQFQDIYTRLKAKGAKYGGVYFFATPTFVLVHPEIIKTVVVKDFEYFTNHSNGVCKDSDPFSAHLFNLEDEPWKSMRTKLTPTFTSGKMKMMFQTFMQCADGLKNVLDECSAVNDPIDIKETLARFTTDIIGSCAFGIECNSIKNPSSEFRQIGRQMFEKDMRKIRLVMFRFVPKSIIELLGIKFISTEVEDFFRRVVRETVEYREKHNIFRKDFMHLLLQLRNRGKVSDDESIKSDEKSSAKQYLTMDEITAQCFVFFAAGFETSSTTMTFALYEIAKNPEIQERLRKEIHDISLKYNDELTYDSITEMSYLDRVVKETLRKYPPLPLIPRACTKDYQLPGTDVIIKKDMRIQIPVIGVHMDPEYYPDPDKFDPDRFTEENKAKRPNFTWIPFGEGPRNCIGLRFGLLQSKVGIATIIKNFKVCMNDKTATPLVIDPSVFVTAVKGGIWLDINKIK